MAMTSTNRVGIGLTTPSSSLHVVGNTILSGSFSTSSAALLIYKSGSTTLDIQGSQGQLFSVVDNLSGSLMSVNDVSGLPILEVFSDDRVVMGTYGTPAMVITGSNTIISGSLRGNVISSSIASTTASLDLAQIASGSLSGTSVSLTGLTADFMMLEVKGANFTSGAQGLAVTLNTAVTNYNFRGFFGTTTSGEAIIGDTQSEIYPNKSQAASGSGSFYLTLQNCKSAGFTTFQQSGTLLNSTYFGFNLAGYYNAEIAITSIQIKGTGGGTFNAGTYRLIGA
jgi:hypothetical protein